MTQPTQPDAKTHASDASPDRPRTALVFGGAGSTGNAWLIGVIAGLWEAGLDVTDADLIIGTSAGSTAAAQVTAARAVDLLAEIVAATPRQRTSPASSDRIPGRPATDYIAMRRAIIDASSDAADWRRRLGASALESDAATRDAAQTQWRATVAARLPSQRWPAQRLLITAVDADTGEAVVFDRDSGVDLVDAVAASCSSRFAYPIGDGRFIDGGYRSNAENADLASGYERVLVLSPFSGASLTPVEWGLHLATQIDALRAGGSVVETVFPDAEANHLFGNNAMNPSLRAPAALAGHGQGLALAERLRAFWR